MSGYPRYAIYFVPAPDRELYWLGAHALGYDAFNGGTLPVPRSVLLAASDWLALTEDPRKYGFHATLKAPLTLAAGRTEAELLAACVVFASMARPIPVIRPTVRAVDLGAAGQFIALVPAEPSADLNRLAQDCVAAFDAFRAPLTEQDRARRNPGKLTASQRENLDRWGYPYVMEEFRFHMTLTGAVPVERRDHLIAMLEGYFVEQTHKPLAVDSIALCRQEDADSRFRILGHHLLSLELQ
jgi:putative phosphonate metabolism protein